MASTSLVMMGRLAVTLPVTFHPAYRCLPLNLQHCKILHITLPDHPPMKPTFSSPAAAIARDRAPAVLLIPPCLHSPPDETKAPTLPEKKAVVAMAARAVDLINMLAT